MKDETGGVSIEEFVRLKPKMYLFLVEFNEHKKAKGAIKHVVAMIGHNEYKDKLLKNKCLRHSMNRIKGNEYFDDKIYIQNNGYDRLALGYQS